MTDPAAMRDVRITRRVFARIMDTVGRLPAETGGSLAMAPDGTVCDFYFDVCARTSELCYTPSGGDLARVANLDWGPRGLHLCGIVHSHKKRSPPSKRDILSARSLMNANGMELFLLPIVAEGEMTVYCLAAEGSLRAVSCIII